MHSEEPRFRRGWFLIRPHQSAASGRRTAGVSVVSPSSSQLCMSNPQPRCQIAGCYRVQPFACLPRGIGVSVSDEELYTKHKDDLTRYATALVGPNAAEDVVATVVVRVLQRGGFGTLADARPYLFRAVLNETRGLLRKRARTIAVDDVPAEIPPEDHDLLALVLDLPVRQRAVVYLVYWEGNTIREAAELMQVVPGTAKRYLHLARRKIRGVL